MRLPLPRLWFAFLIALSGGCAIVPAPTPEPIPAPLPVPNPSPTPGPTPTPKPVPVAVLAVVVPNADLSVLIPLGAPFQSYTRTDGVEIRSYRVVSDAGVPMNAHIQIKGGKIHAPPDLR